VEGHVLKGPTYKSVAIGNADTGNWSHTITLLYSDAAIPPARSVDWGVKKLCSLSYSIPYREIRKLPTYVSAGKTWRNVSFSRDIKCGGANLEYRVSYNDQLLKSVEAEYIDDF